MWQCWRHNLSCHVFLNICFNDVSMLWVVLPSSELSSHTQSTVYTPPIPLINKIDKIRGHHHYYIQSNYRHVKLFLKKTQRKMTQYILVTAIKCNVFSWTEGTHPFIVMQPYLVNSWQHDIYPMDSIVVCLNGISGQWILLHFNCSTTCKI